MLNAIKMDLYRMIKSRSLYITGICLIVFLFISMALTKEDIKSINESSIEGIEESMKEQDDSTINLGMNMNMPVQPGEKITIFDEIYAHFSCKFIAIFIGIFAVLFSTADLHSGYIKNIGGQVENRAWLVFSKAVTLTIVTAIFILLSVFAIVVAHCILFGTLNFGNLLELFSYLGMQYLLYTAFSLIVMGISILLKNNAVSMTLSICMCMNLIVIIYGLINKFATQIGAEKFNVLEYTITGNISYLTMTIEKGIYIRSFIAAICFIILSMGVSVGIMKKRDI